MEKRQLDFNTPLLSTRRLSSPRNPIEKRATPGPGPHSSDWEPDDIIKPAAVPFQWEQTPGRPKNEPDARFPTPISPGLPPGRAQRLSGPSKFNPGPINPAIVKKLDAGLKCKDEVRNSETENEEDKHADSINGLSLDASSGVSGRPSGKFLVDKTTQDFLMSRFLPAAKAVAAAAATATVRETPRPTAKASAAVGPTDEGAVEEMTRPVASKVGLAKIMAYYGKEDFYERESEEEEERDRVAMKKAGKSWGIIPRVKSRLSLLPAVKSKSRPSMPMAGEERRLRRNAVSGPLDKNGRQLPPPSNKNNSGLLSGHLHGPVKTSSKTSSHDSFPLLTTRPDSPLKRYHSHSVSPYRNEPPFISIPNETNNKIASTRKMFKALHDVSRNQPARPVAEFVEKTLYIDSVNKTSSKYSSVKEEMEVSSGGDRGGGECEVGPKKSPLHLLPPPPLPESPAESWLWRTLPSTAFGRSRWDGHEQVKKDSGGVDLKWESIGKNLNMRHRRLLEELIPQATNRQRNS